jgi:hypothetical protein
VTVESIRTAGLIQETPSPEDDAAIRACVLDYFEGWFDGDAARMDRALHPGLAKHSLSVDRDGNEALDITTKSEMVEATERGLGRRRDDRAITIEIVGFGGDIASVVVHSAVYLEYAFLARTRDGWRITGTLWRYIEGHGRRG